MFCIERSTIETSKREIATLTCKYESCSNEVNTKKLPCFEFIHHLNNNQNQHDDIGKNRSKLLSKNQLASYNKLQKRNASAFKFQPDIAPANLGETTKMNLFQSVTNALDISLSADKSAG